MGFNNGLATTGAEAVIYSNDGLTVPATSCSHALAPEIGHRRIRRPVNVAARSAFDVEPTVREDKPAAADRVRRATGYLHALEDAEVDVHVMRLR